MYVLKVVFGKDEEKLFEVPSKQVPKRYGNKEKCSLKVIFYQKYIKDYLWMLV